MWGGSRVMRRGRACACLGLAGWWAVGAMATSTRLQSARSFVPLLAPNTARRAETGPPAPKERRQSCGPISVGVCARRDQNPQDGAFRGDATAAESTRRQSACRRPLHQTSPSTNRAQSASTLRHLSSSIPHYSPSTSSRTHRPPSSTPISPCRRWSPATCSPSSRRTGRCRCAVYYNSAA